MIRFRSKMYRWGLLLLALFVACTVLYLININLDGQKNSNRLFVIGVSQPDLKEPTQIVMNREIHLEAEHDPNVRLIFTDAADNSDKQISDIKNLMGYGINLLIISINDAEKLTPIVSQVYQKIPVIVLGRGVNGYDYTLYIGSDNVSIGSKMGEYAAQLLAGKTGQIIELQGQAGSPQVSETTQGFREAIKTAPGLKVIRTLSADWQRDKAEDLIHELLPKYTDVRLIFAHSDAMALGAYRAVKTLGYKNIQILGVDGLDTANGGVDLVKQGVLNGTVTSQTGGKEAVQYALSILHGDKVVPKKILLHSHLITRENADQFSSRENNETSPDPRNLKFDKKIRLGVAIVGSESSWRNANTASIISAAKKDPNIELLIQNAEGDQARQIDIIRDFIWQKVDVIAFSPIVETGWDDVLKEAKAAGIPIILTDRTIKTDDDTLWSTFIGSDFVEEGRRAARWLVEHQQGREHPLRIVELEGTTGSAPAIGRKTGFDSIISQHPQFSITASVSGNFTLESGQQLMEHILAQGGSPPDAVFAHNDDMAIGAIRALDKAGLKAGKDVLVLSVDATHPAFDAMIAGKLNVSVECNPLLGPQIINAAKELAEGIEIPAQIITSEGIFTQENANRELDTREY